jgi:hypothetical protein
MRLAVFFTNLPWVRAIYRFIESRKHRSTANIYKEPCGMVKKDSAADLCEEDASNQEWICKSVFIGKQKLEETYIFPSADSTTSNFLPVFNTPPISDTPHNTVIYIFKSNDRGLRRSSSKYTPEFHTQKLEPSSVSFIDVQYSHPDMKEPIILNIGKEWYCIGNELFTSVFVLRALLHQPLPFTFDERYQVDIMDGNLDTTVLTYGQYLVIEERGHCIMQV